MLEISHREALQDNGCLNLLELQDTAQHLSWKKASTNEVTFACYLANRLDIHTGRVRPIPPGSHGILSKCNSGSPSLPGKATSIHTD